MIKIIQFLLLAFLCIFTTNAQSLKTCNLKCDYKTNPIGIDNLSPTLSWQIKGDKIQDVEQTAYQILVATSEELLTEEKADVWNSGVVESRQSAQVIYTGKTLKSRCIYFWTVKVWTNKENLTVESQSASWEMGLLRTSDWKGRWISAPHVFSFSQRARYLRTVPLDTPPVQTEASPYLRKGFEILKPVKRARLYISGLGYYETYLNGFKVGDHVLDPAWTSYHMRTLYTTYDVTTMLQQGKNAWGIQLGDGWYNQHSIDTWSIDLSPWRDRPKVLAQLNVLYYDGTSETVVTDDYWKAHMSPLIFTSIRQGETYDARHEIKDWNKPGFDDSKWNYVWRAMAPTGDLIAQELEPVRVKESFKPYKITQPTDSTYLLYYPMDLAGWVKIRVKENPGTKITLTYGEVIDDDGTLNQDRIKEYTFHERFQTDEYICATNDWEEWHAKFTYHGFTYVEVKGLSSKPKPENFIAESIYTDMAQHSFFLCSDEMINRIHDLTPWTIKGNAHGYAEASPHREKLGWTGDAHLAAEATLLNFDSKLFYRKWIGDIAMDQHFSGELSAISPTSGWGFFWGNGPAWDAAFILIPWYQYIHTGDVFLLQKYYDRMKLYFNYLDKRSEGNIANFGLGDWCPPYSDKSDGYETPFALTSTSYFYVNAIILSKVSDLLGYNYEAQRYKQKAAEIKIAFNEKFYDTKTTLYEGNTQTSQACALYQGLTTKKNHDVTVKHLVEQVKIVDNHLNTGILGTKYLLNALSDNGQEELAYSIVTNKTYPGWGYWIEQGATTMWERWAGKGAGGNAKNFTFVTEVDVWFYKYILGIKPIEAFPGYKKFEMSPYFFEKFDWAKGKIATMYGDIEVDWSKNGNLITYDVRIPENSSAIFVIPNGYRFKNNQKYTRFGSGVHSILLERVNPSKNR